MKDFVEISKDEVWEYFKNGKEVFCAILESSFYDVGVYNISEGKLYGWQVKIILKEENVIFFARKEE